jgi:hypothetical protein
MPFGIPDATDLEKAGEKLEDHGIAGIDAEVKTIRQQVEEILGEWEVVVSFRKKDAPKAV